MQTFLPYPNFRLSAHVLDRQRLGKQRLECMQLLTRSAASRSLSARVGWEHHPASLMWRGWEAALVAYTHCIITEWCDRGYTNNMPTPATPEGAAHWGLPEEWGTLDGPRPPWLGWERLHASHRAALRYKNDAWYKQFLWEEKPEYNYAWPGRIPAPGEYLIGPRSSSDVWIVVARTIDELEIVRDGVTQIVPTRDVYCGEWKRGVSGE